MSQHHRCHTDDSLFFNGHAQQYQVSTELNQWLDVLITVEYQHPVTCSVITSIMYSGFWCQCPELSGTMHYSMVNDSLPNQSISRTRAQVLCRWMVKTFGRGTTCY